jgi:predicted O-methyltransferase YrrM
MFNQINPSHMVLIDLFEGITYSGDQNGKNKQYINLEDAYKTLKLYFKDKNVNIYKGKSSEIMKRLPNEYFDLIYVDADHSYEGTYIDLVLSYEKIKKNGIICGHDFNFVLYPEVVKAVQHFLKNFNLKLDYTTRDILPTYGIIKK